MHENVNNSVADYQQVNLKYKLRDNNSHVSSTAPCLLMIPVLSRNAAPSLCEGGDARFGNQENIVKRGLFVRDVEVKNKSPVSLSIPTIVHILVHSFVFNEQILDKAKQEFSRFGD